jgi:hypothetical protein
VDGLASICLDEADSEGGSIPVRILVRIVVGSADGAQILRRERRYMVLYDEGGYYADCDVDCSVPIKDWVKQYHPRDFQNANFIAGLEIVTGTTPRSPNRQFHSTFVNPIGLTRNYRSELRREAPVCSGIPDVPVEYGLGAGTPDRRARAQADSAVLPQPHSNITRTNQWIRGLAVDHENEGSCGPLRTSCIMHFPMIIVYTILYIRWMEQVFRDWYASAIQVHHQVHGARDLVGCDQSAHGGGVRGAITPPTLAALQAHPQFHMLIELNETNYRGLTLQVRFGVNEGHQTDDTPAAKRSLPLCHGHHGARIKYLACQSANLILTGEWSSLFARRDERPGSACG